MDWFESAAVQSADDVFAWSPDPNDCDPTLQPILPPPPPTEEDAEDFLPPLYSDAGAAPFTPAPVFQSEPRRTAIDPLPRLPPDLQSATTPPEPLPPDQPNYAAAVNAAADEADDDLPSPTRFANGPPRIPVPDDDDDDEFAPDDLELPIHVPERRRHISVKGLQQGAASVPEQNVGPKNDSPFEEMFRQPEIEERLTRGGGGGG